MGAPACGDVMKLQIKVSSRRACARFPPAFLHQSVRKFRVRSGVGVNMERHSICPSRVVVYCKSSIGAEIALLLTCSKHP